MECFSTIGLRAVDLRSPYQRWQLVRFEGDMQKDGSWIVRAVSGHNLSPLNRKPLRLSAGTLDALPHSTTVVSSKNGKHYGCNNLLHFASVQLVKLSYTAHIDNTTRSAS